MKQVYLLSRNEPTADEADRSILERTDDSLRENKTAKTRYTLNMIATICDCCGDTTYYPLDDRFVCMGCIVDDLSAGMETEIVELENHHWHRAGPLDEEALRILEGAAFDSVLHLLPVIEGVTEPEADKVEAPIPAKTLN